MVYLKHLLFLLLPIIKIIVFGLLFILMHFVLVGPLLISGVLTGADFGREDNGFRLIMLAISLLSTVFSILVANRVAKSWKPSLATLGITPAVAKSTCTGLLIGAALVTLCFLVIMGVSEGQLAFIGFPTRALLSLLLVFLTVSISEELLSRGYLLPYLEKHYGALAAIILSSLIFTAIHLGNDHLSTVGLLSIFLAGVMLAQLRMIYGNLWVPIGAHITWNYLQGAVFGFSVSGHVTESILLPTFDSPSLINGGEFGIEGSIIAVLVLSGAIFTLARMQYLRSASSTPTRELPLEKVSRAAAA